MERILYINSITGLCSFQLCILCILVSLEICLAGPSCADGSSSLLYGHNNIATCTGHWHGHIENSSNICGAGWRVCSWYDHRALKSIRWEAAISVKGCYAFNAAQDGGRCRQCRDDLEQDDLAGIGRGCPHQNFGQTSCITGGRIDASCCVDSHFKRGCHHQPGIITGVLCCKMPARRPKIVVKPRERIEVTTGYIFLLTCQATGMPPPRIQWYKDGKQIPQGNQRIQMLPSGDLLVTLARRSDSGLYSCEVINEKGMDMASSTVFVKEENSGCRDGTTEGLSSHRDIHACAGKWEGHVRKGKRLCKKGWRVCSPRNKHQLQALTWLDVFDLDGCFAYNAGNKRNKCQRCQSGYMAGIGKNCGRMRYSRTSCLAQGRVDVFKKPDKNLGCNYKEGVTTGVLCCKKSKRSRKRPHKICSPPCQNGGVCIGHNRCECPRGYKGAMCQNPLCEKGCGSQATCIRPGVCECKSGFTGPGCKRKIKNPKHICRHRCHNGGRCRRGRCKCPPTHYGRTCQHLLESLLLTHLNRTER